MSQIWAMGKALSELMERHRQTMPAPSRVPLSEPTSTPMLLSGLASTADVDIERVQFAPPLIRCPTACRSITTINSTSAPAVFSFSRIIAAS